MCSSQPTFGFQCVVNWEEHFKVMLPLVSQNYVRWWVPNQNLCHSRRSWLWLTIVQCLRYYIFYYSYGQDGGATPSIWASVMNPTDGPDVSYKVYKCFRACTEDPTTFWCRTVHTTQIISYCSLCKQNLPLEIPQQAASRVNEAFEALY